MSFDRMTIVRIQNDHPTKTHRINYYTTSHVLPPGKSAMVPWECAISVMGDPRIYNNGRLTARNDEVARILHFWGYHTGLDTADQERAKDPKLSCWDQDGNRIWMLLDDPLNEQPQTSPLFDGAVADATPADRITVLERSVAALLANNERLVALLEAKAPGTVAEELPSLVADAGASQQPDLTGIDEPESEVTFGPDALADIAAQVNVGGELASVGVSAGAQYIPEAPENTGAVPDTPRGRRR